MRRALLAAIVGSVLLALPGAAAGKDTTLTLYTSMPEKDLPAFIGPFEKKHGITVKVWRASSAKILQRALSEAGARRFEVDAFLMSAPELEALNREKLLDPAGWAPVYLAIWVQAYNTTLVRRDELPRTFRDLLEPRWKGKLGVEAGDWDWFATLAAAMGEAQAVALFRDMVAKNGVSVRQGHTLLTNLVVSGEVPLALTVYRNMPEAAKRRGAPVDWIALEPVVARANAVAVARRAPRRDAALRFHAYMLSDAQPILAGLDYTPAAAGARATLRDRKLHLVDPGRVLDEREKWSRSWEVIVLKRGGQP